MKSYQLRLDRNTSRRSCVAYIHRHKESARILFDKTSEIALTHSVSTGVSTGSGGGSAPKYKSICIIEVMIQDFPLIWKTNMN